MEQQKYETTGVIASIPDKEQHGNLTIQKVVLDVPGFKDRMETCVFEFKGKSADKPDKFDCGQAVTISWELQGREHNGRVYNSLSAWKIEAAGGHANRQPDRKFSNPPEQPARQYRQPPESVRRQDAKRQGDSRKDDSEYDF